MSENTFIKKRQKERSKPFLTLRIIFGLILMSLMIWAGFYFEYGSVGDVDCDGPCENAHSLGSWVLGFSFIFLGVIAVGALFGGIFAALRWSKNRNQGALSSLMIAEEKPDTKTPDSE